MRIPKLLSLLALIVLSSPLAAEPAVHVIDPVHSGVAFKVRHYLNRVPGIFTSFTGEIHYDPDNPAACRAVATIDASSVDTRSERRDNHLRNEDFFDVAKHPSIQYESTEWIPAGDGRYTVKGNLTMLGQTHEVVLDVEFLGEMEARGGIRSGWEAKGKIDRNQWGISYGPAVVGKDVEIELTIQARR
jgi:polyisoprenoid-binding protein YceI